MRSNRDNIRKQLVKDIEFAQRMLNSPYILKNEYVCATSDYRYVLAHDRTGFGAKLLHTTADLRYAMFMSFADANEIMVHWNESLATKYLTTHHVNVMHYKDLLRQFVHLCKTHLEKFETAVNN